MDILIELALRLAGVVLYSNRNGAVQTKIRWGLYGLVLFTAMVGLAYGGLGLVSASLWQTMAMYVGAPSTFIIFIGEVWDRDLRLSMVAAILAALFLGFALYGVIWRDPSVW